MHKNERLCMVHLKKKNNSSQNKTYLNSVIFDVEIAGNTSQVCWKHVSSMCFKTYHLCFVQPLSCFSHQNSPVFFKKWVILQSYGRSHSQLKETKDYIFFLNISDIEWERMKWLKRIIKNLPASILTHKRYLFEERNNNC